MTTARDEVHTNIEAYLDRLRRELRGLNNDDVREVVEELRSHIMEKAAEAGEITAADVEAALIALGSPEELASQYRTDALLARAATSHSPFRILHSLFRWASLSLAGVIVLLASLLGYFLGLAFLLCALLKSIHPRTAGLWAYRDGVGDLSLSLRMGFEGAPAGARELLGWWVVPLGLTAGSLLLLGTTRFALWCAHRYRKSRALPQT